jgi:hypothetical protein
MKRSKFAISRDKDIKAQKPGKRAANKNRETYYEYRENRTDSDLRKKLEWGGTAESSETGVPIGGENQSSMYKTGGEVGKYEKLVKDNWDEITYSYETGGSKLPKTISSGDAEGFLEEFDDSFSNMSEEEQSNAITKFKNAFKSLRTTKMQTGGQLNETFPETDAMSYKNGGGVGDETYWKNMPKNAAKDLAEYYGNKKLDFNKKELNLSKKDLAELKEVQMMINKYHPEFNHYLSLMHKEHKMEMGGSTNTWCYSIGGL